MKDETGVDSHYGRFDFDLERPVDWLLIGSNIGYPDPECLEGSLAEIMLLEQGSEGCDEESRIVGAIRVYPDRLVVYSDNRETEVRTIRIDPNPDE